ncbi:hypothetical protein PMAYCL1PPCAC_06305 [Pristionchus mayeri]|uniref:Uncharacterized protein n=1 Tax=Pristionchus mayeri TaxID=1317129 RepID=A0AAN5C9Z5_9BILA|nr:hypothetical protein PMAYCL1PPCAC_06305 [Pristionchus mayeri]
MVCPSGTLVLGYESTMFPTLFERNGRMIGINVWLWKEFARMNKCDSLRFVEFSMNGSYCDSDQCGSSLSRAMEERGIFTNVDSPFLTPNHVQAYKYSSMSDFARLVMMEGRPRRNEVAQDIRLYTVFQPEIIVLIIISFGLRYLLDLLRGKLTLSNHRSSYKYKMVINILDFINQFINLSMVTMLFLFYQCVFNGNAVIVNSQVFTDFHTVADALLKGSRRLLVDIGILMNNEYSSFGPLTTLVDSAVDRIVRMCSDNDDVVLFWDDEMLLITEIDE